MTGMYNKTTQTTHSCKLHMLMYCRSASFFLHAKKGGADGRELVYNAYHLGHSEVQHHTYIT